MKSRRMPVTPSTRSFGYISLVFLNIFNFFDNKIIFKFFPYILFFKSFILILSIKIFVFFIFAFAFYWMKNKWFLFGFYLQYLFTNVYKLYFYHILKKNIFYKIIKIIFTRFFTYFALFWFCRPPAVSHCPWRTETWSGSSGSGSGPTQKLWPSLSGRWTGKRSRKSARPSKWSCTREI